MKFSRREDVSAPAEAVFDSLSDFVAFERAALRRGPRLRRLDSLRLPGAGLSWDITFPFRGKQRQMIADVRRFDKPEVLEYAGVSPSFEMSLAFTLVALSRQHTRLHAEFEIRPRSLGARLMIQSAKLGRASLNSRYNKRIAALARNIETRTTS
jgi:hypothetical protein